MALVLKCLFYDDYVTKALYFQVKENDAIIISRIVMGKTLLCFAPKALLLQLNGYTVMVKYEKKQSKILI